MRITRNLYGLLVGVAIVGLTAAPLGAQAVTCGSTGADGAFSPTADTTLTLPPSGVFNFATVNIPSGVTVTFAKNAANTPVTILATGDVTITGGIEVNGKSGATSGIPGQGGPGGFDGGMGGNVIVGLNGTSGLGPGGGGGGDGSDTTGSAGGFGTAGQGTKGGQTHGLPTLIPLLGGSGGGGARGSTTGGGGGGGGGGGAILICSPATIAFGSGSASIRAFGGAQGGGGVAAGGGGSGGAIRLIANRITGPGFIQALGGTTGAGAVAAGGLGRIRLEAVEIALAATVNPPPSAGLPGPVTPPANTPTLRITAVAGVAPPANPQGSFLATPDITLSPTVTNPVTVNLAASNVPVGTSIAVTVKSEGAAPTTTLSTGLTGTLASSTASASVTLPNGTSVISATATFATSTASLGTPLMVGEEEVKWMRVGAVYGGESTVMYITASGKEVRVQ